MKIIFSSNKKDKFGFLNICFENPIKIISCFRLKDVKETFDNLEEALCKGYYLAGFISYEAGFAFEEKFYNDKMNDFPLIWFGVFRDKGARGQGSRGKGQGERRAPTLKNLRLNVTEREYCNAVKKIKELIANGDTYQVNYTLKYKFDFTGDPYNFYNELKNKQSVSYSAYIDSGDFKIISLSPELFFAKKNNLIFVKPMKGTIKRGINIDEDQRLSRLLKNDPKNRAENIMIVDLMRNDLGRIAYEKNIKTTNLFEVQKFETLFQMTSSIKARIKNNIHLYNLFSSIFPSGSVTGAPKVYTMEIIKNSEKEDRKIYTGAIGYIFPNKNMIFNVAIRTILIEKEKAEMGIGSGIVYDSRPQNEYNECKLKADFLTKPMPGFDLIETILWEKGSFFLLNEHLKRLNKSAAYFIFQIKLKKIKRLLENISRKFSKSKKYKVRLLLSKDGEIDITYEIIAPKSAKQNNSIIISKLNTNSGNIFLHHKTTNRSLYNNEHNKYSQEGYCDVIFMNEKKEVTEGAISNIIIKKDEKLYTPPIKCGLLNGVYRQYFMGINKVFEKIIYKGDIENANEIFLCNSVRGLMKVKL